MRVLSSKITVPKITSHLIRRQRLLDRLQVSKSRASVLLVAPAGYGKTSLATQFLSGLPLSMKCWLTLESQDVQPAVFARYILEALSRPLPTLKQSGLYDMLDSGATDLREFTNDLCFFLEEHKGPRICMVLDNWEAVAHCAEVSQVVERLITYPRVRLRMIINSRINPEFRMQKLQADGRLIVICKDDLKFTREELVEAIQVRTSIRLSEDKAEMAYETTRGWCVTAGFANELMHRLDNKDDGLRFRSLNQTDSILEYCNQEVASNLTPELRSFLAYCSVLDTVSPQSCGVFCGNPQQISDMLDLLRESSVPHTVVSENEYRLHPVMRSACNVMLRKRISHEEMEALYRRVSEYYLSNDNLAKAIDVLFEIEDFDGAVCLIRDHWFTLLSSLDPSSVGRWLALVPAESRNSFCYVEAQTRLLGILGRFDELANLLEDRLKGTSLENGHPVLGTMWHQYNHCLFLTRKGHRYKAILSDWEKFNKRRGPFAPSVLVGVEDLLGFAAYDGLRVCDAIGHVESALDMSNHAMPSATAKYRALLGLLNHELGHAKIAEKSMLRLVDELRRSDPSHSTPMVLVFLARMFTCMGQYDRALSFVDLCRSEIEASKVFFDTIHVHLERYAGICRIYQGKVEEGLRHLEASAKWAHDTHLAESSNSALIFEYYREVFGDGDSKVEGSGSKEQLTVSEESLNRTILTAYREIKASKLRRALQRIKHAKKIVRSESLKPWVVTCDFFESWILWHLGNQRSAGRLLREGLKIMDEIGWRNYPLASPEVMAFVVSGAVAYNIRARSLKRISFTGGRYSLQDALLEFLSSSRLSPDRKAALINFGTTHQLSGLASVVKQWDGTRHEPLAGAVRRFTKARSRMPLPKLTVRTLGVFSVTKENLGIKFARSKARDLFLWLLSQHPGGIREEVVMEHFWPDAPECRAKPNLQTVVSALRRSLDERPENRNKSYILYDANQYSLDIPTGSDIDFHEFDALCRSVRESAAKEPDLTNSIERSMRSALELYRGAFLSNLNLDSVLVTKREALNREYLDILDLYVSRLIAAKNFRAAQSIVERGLSSDPFWANGVRSAMDIFVQSGKLLYALKAYRDYESRLLVQFNLAPDNDLLEYFRTVQQM